MTNKQDNYSGQALRLYADTFERVLRLIESGGPGYGEELADILADLAVDVRELVYEL